MTVLCPRKPSCPPTRPGGWVGDTPTPRKGLRPCTLAVAQYQLRDFAFSPRRVRLVSMGSPSGLCWLLPFASLTLFVPRLVYFEV
jgi:hypothetical protein